MASNPDDSSFEDTSSSLGDSAYDFIEDKSVAETDDEEQEQEQSTQSGLSSDECDSDLQAGQRQSSENCEDAREKSLPRSHARSLPADHEESSTSKTRPATKPHTGSEYISVQESSAESKTLEEHRRPKVLFTEAVKPGKALIDDTEGSCVVKVFNANEISKSLPLVRVEPQPARITANLRQSMAMQPIVVKKPYKVLYVGHFSAKDSIMNKLGSALVASLEPPQSRPSRFSIVPISSFGDATSVEVDLIDSTGIEMIIEECSNSSFTKMDGGNDTISMTLTDQMLVESSWNGSKYVMTEHWDPPALAVFCISDIENSTKTKRTHHFARKFLSRHQIPYIAVSEKPLWNNTTELITLDQRTPHFCLEAHDSASDNVRIIKRLPIDKETFLNLDSIQMSRNLACLARCATSPKLSTFRNTPFQTLYDEAQKESNNSDGRSTCIASPPYLDESVLLHKVIKMKGTIASILFIILGLVFYHVSKGLIVGPSAIFAIGRVSGNSITTPNPVSPTPTMFSAASLHSDVSSSSFVPFSKTRQSPISQRNVVQRTNTDLVALLPQRSSLLPNASEKFKMSALGDRHVLLIPPQWFSRLRKAPKLLFRVRRDGCTIDHQVSMVFDGVYALKIPREEAFGNLNVTVWTSSKPIINEESTVKFGTSWFVRYGKGKHAVSESLRKTTDAIQKISLLGSNAINNGAESLKLIVLREADRFQKEIMNLGILSLNKTTEATKSVRFQTQLLSHRFATYKDLPTVRNTVEHVIYLRQCHVCTRLKAFTLNIEAARRKHLREYQKKALKTWWKVIGRPKQVYVKQNVSVTRHSQNFMWRRKSSR